MFDFKDRYGWSIWTTRVSGLLLRIAIKEALQRGFYFSSSGITYDMIHRNGEVDVQNLRINGSKMRWWKSYTIALPEGIARGSAEISHALRLILRNPTNTGTPIWLALEENLKRVQVLSDDLYNRRVPASLNEHHHDHHEHTH
jgi:5'-nucleotidase / UDP-sugar diphosphatase